MTCAPQWWSTPSATVGSARPRTGIFFWGGEPRLLLLAVPAQAEDLSSVPGQVKTVLLRQAVSPLFDWSASDFNGAAAIGADKVMMVVVTAQPVESLSGGIVQNIDNVHFCKGLERPIDRRQADLVPTFRQRLMNVSSGAKIRGLTHNRHDGAALASTALADAGCGRPRGGVCPGASGGARTTWVFAITNFVHIFASHVTDTTRYRLDKMR